MSSAFYTGKVAAVTGAASGIGQALAIELARRGAHVAISDVDTAGLAETEKAITSLGGKVHSAYLDVAQVELVAEYAQTIAAHFGTVNMVFNNAGIAYTGTTLEEGYKDIHRVMDVDFWGVVNGTKEFLPHLIDSGDGHVINISSVFGLFSVPTQGAYNAAKFAVRGFTEALSLEMRASSHPVKVTCVHPGGIKTNIARNADQSAGRDHDDLATSFDKLARTSPEKAAKVILKGVEKGKTRVLIGADAWALDKFIRIAGPAYQPLVSKFSSRSGL